ncbi:MAG: hypothetical protein V3U96_09970 [Paracoccaceae bacterium]
MALDLAGGLIARSVRTRTGEYGVDIADGSGNSFAVYVVVFWSVGKGERMDLSRFSAAPGTHLSGNSFKSQGDFPA